MLDAFIIEELRRREELERGHGDRPMMELPLDDRHEKLPAPREEDARDKPQRGVVVIDF
jgi:hypothetical protein